MAVIKPKRGSSYPASGLAENELAVDTTNRRIYIGSEGGSGITVGSHLTDYVSSVNGATGAITNVAKTDTANTFTPVQTFTNGIISSAGITIGDGASSIPLRAAATTIAYGIGANTNGLFGAAIGHSTLTNQTALTVGNFAFGYQALEDTTSGANNVAIGNAAVSNNTTGSFHVGVGNYSLSNMTSGSNNTAIGFESGFRHGAASNLTTIDNSIFIGYNSRAGANSDTNEIVIGYNVAGKGSNTSSIGNADTTQTFLYGRVDAEDGLSAGSTGITTSGPISSATLYVSAGSTLANVTASSTTNTIDILASTDAAGIRIAQAASGAGSRIGSIRLGRAPTTGFNTYIENSAGVLTIYNGVDNLGTDMMNIRTTEADFSVPVQSDGGFRITSNAINAQTGTSYSLLSSDNGKIVTMSNASPITLTVPSGLPVGFNTTVIQLGAGAVGITSSGTTLNSFESKLNMAGQHAAVSIISYTSNVFNVAGGLTA